MPILLLFLVLQVCDLLTTMLFLRHGVTEANPLVAALMHVFSQPAVAVMAVKLVACVLAVYAWHSRRTRLLRWANLFFAVCVGWNLVAIARA
jgi:hypothetical protein